RVRLPTYPFERKRYWVEPAALVSMPQASTAVVSSVPAGDGAAAAESRTPRPRRTAATPRRELIASMLQALLSELSGLGLQQMDTSKSFMEMGFDSLFLTQASQAIEQRLGVRVAFADLLDKYS